MTSTLITKKFSQDVVGQLIASLTEPTNTVLYVFAGNPVPYTGGDSNVPALFDDEYTTNFNPYTNMLFGKQVTTSDMVYMATRHDWVANTVYTQYDDQNANLFSLPFYATVNAGSYYHTFKCLYNNNGAPSTIYPDFSSSTQDADLYDVDDGYYETSDGYQWKYMYTVDANTFNEFATTNYVPVIANTVVQSSATVGAIDTILVTGSGARYDNHITGAFSANDLRVSSTAVQFTGISQDVLYALGSSANGTNTFYTTCIMKLTAGTGAGQYKTVVDYINDGVHNIARLDTPFTIQPDTTTLWEVMPAVLVYGEGSQSLNCIARALVNTNASNSIFQTEILERGQGYLAAVANIPYSNVVPVANTASLRPIMSPYGGHGYNVYNELGATSVGVSVTFANNENGEITTNNSYRQVGILKNPLFANVEFNIAQISSGNPGSDGIFLPNEVVSVYKTYQLAGSVSVNASSVVLTGTGTDFANSLSTNSSVLIVSGNTRSIGKISHITNATSLQLTSNGVFQNSAAAIYAINFYANGTCANVTSSTINLVNVEPFFHQYDSIIGQSSFAVANVTAMSINGSSRSAGFQVFNQLTMFQGSATGTFTNNEIIYDTTLTNANAIFQSGNSSVLYATNIFGPVRVGETLIGSSSGASFLISSISKGDIVPGHSDILYLQNNLAVQRSNTQSETIKLVISF